MIEIVGLLGVAAILGTAAIFSKSFTSMCAAIAVPVDGTVDASYAEQLRSELETLEHEKQVAEELGYGAAAIEDLTRQIASVRVLLRYAAEEKSEETEPVVADYAPSALFPIYIGVGQRQPCARLADPQVVQPNC
ncbi:MAG: hypothetical protein K2W82_16990 [Candidatus Obscuribacterales bacterium]|nr:hypothetical protein [Candidatus Obscuribacterales bacterium]